MLSSDAYMKFCRLNNIAIHIFAYTDNRSNVYVSPILQCNINSSTFVFALHAFIIKWFNGLNGMFLIQQYLNTMEKHIILMDEVRFLF